MKETFSQDCKKLSSNKTNNKETEYKETEYKETNPSINERSYKNLGTLSRGSKVPDPQTKKHGIALELSKKEPTRATFTFEGWSRTPAGKVVYKPGDRYTIDASTTLYAVWKENVYTITYNTYGGKNVPAQQKKTHDVDLTLSTMRPTLDGHIFKGWSTARMGKVMYNPKDIYKSNANITLHAVWETGTYNVTYDANGGSGGPTRQAKKHGSTLELTKDTPTKKGSYFAGWSTTKSGKATHFAGGKYTANASIYLYAVWKSTYTITYHANGGYSEPGEQTKRSDTSLLLSKIEPKRSGYTLQ